MGFFGYVRGFTRNDKKKTEVPPQPLHRARVDLDVALESVGEILERWWSVAAWPEAPAFSGGVLDAWPSRIADGLAVCRSEWAAVQSFLRWEAEQKEARGG